jgi:hypothetical protein
MNGGAGTGAVDFFHGFQVALMMTVMFNLTQFVYWRCKLSRRGSCWQVYQPAVWTLMATFMVNFQPLWILMIGSWHLCCADCETFLPGVTNVDGSCSSTKMTYPPWGNHGNGTGARECDVNGNLFWDKSYCTGKKIPIFPTKASGWVVQICLTWGGFVFMFIGVMQATQLHKKLAKRWRAIRSGR